MKELNQILLDEIKSKKQIEGLPNELILEKISKFFLRKGDIRKKIEKEFCNKKEKIIKSKIFKEIVKIIRQELGVVYGSFLTSNFNKKEKELDKAIEIQECDKILMMHKSTRERTNDYMQIYDKIFNWYKPQKIGDLACGLNPISINFMKEKLNYIPSIFASDLNPKDMEFLKLFFSKFEIDGFAKAYDLTKLDILEDDNLMSCDLVFLFKALDSLEFVKKNISKKLLKGIKSEKVVVSFPTKSLVSGKEFKQERRNWFIRFLEEQNWKFETFETQNELFFLISK